MAQVMAEWPGSLLATAEGAVFVRHAALPVRADEPALLVHGLGGDSLDWADLGARLRDRIDAYALDLPGFGMSPPPTVGDVSLDAHARAVVHVARTMRGPVHLIGNSLGGAVATRVAAEHPELVRTLTLISPALPDLRPRLWSWQLTLTLLPLVGRRLVDAALHEDPERLAAQVFRLCYGDPAAVTDVQRAHEVELIRRRAGLAHATSVYRSSLRSLVSAYLQRGRRRLWLQAQQVGVPTLLIYGGRDKLVDPRLAQRAAREFPHAQLALLPALGHVAHIEQPDRVAEVVRHFLDGGFEPAARRIAPADDRAPAAGNG